MEKRIFITNGMALEEFRDIVRKFAEVILGVQVKPDRRQAFGI